MIGALVRKIVSDAEADAVKVKNAIMKAVQEVDGVVLPEAAKLEPLVAQVAGAVAPGGATIVNTAYHVLEACAKVLDTAGTSAEQHFTNAGLDVATIQAIKTLIPQLKAAAAKQ